MIVVVDTNVLVSGSITPFGPSGEIVRLISSGELQLCYDVRIIHEYTEVLRRPRFGLPSDRIEHLMVQIAGAGKNVVARSLRHELPDPNDAMFLEVALAGRAEYLVTGNLKHFPGRACQGMKVVSPAVFLRLFAATGKDEASGPSTLHEPRKRYKR